MPSDQRNAFLSHLFSSNDKQNIIFLLPALSFPIIPHSHSSVSILQPSLCPSNCSSDFLCSILSLFILHLIICHFNLSRTFSFCFHLHSLLPSAPEEPRLCSAAVMVGYRAGAVCAEPLCVSPPVPTTERLCQGPLTPHRSVLPPVTGRLVMFLLLQGQPHLLH